MAINKNVINDDFNKPKSVVVNELNSGTGSVTAPTDIANKFNEYFTHIGPNLAAKIPHIAGNYLQFLPNVSKNIFIKPTDTYEIIDIVRGFSSNKSSGFDDFPPRVLKAVIDYICSPLCYICNLSFVNGCFPDSLKLAKVIPLHKCEDKKLLVNYRPISVLSVFSKVLEKLMHERIYKFLDDNFMLNSNQYGFRPKLSTYMALLKLIDKVSREIDKKSYSLGIFLDLSKAFDTVDHKILLDKLNRYGIRGVAYDWIKSYLTNRSQYVHVNDVVSDRLPIVCGVPQGSVLGPLLFIIYINDISNVSKLFDCILFADDTNLFLSHSNIDVLYQLANTELYNISQWFKLNKLSLNIKKTNYVLFSNKFSKFVSLSNIKIDNVKIERVFQTKFLGVVINEKLTWDNHILTVRNKISKGLGILSKIRNIVPCRVLISLYHALVHPHLEYCNIVWAASTCSALNKVFLLQKRAVRIITNSPWLAHTAPLFRKLNLLTIGQINKLQSACFMFKCVNCDVPIYFSNMFVTNINVHQHNTRQVDCLHVYPSRTKIRQFSIAVYGIKIWNSLPENLRNIGTLTHFKKQYKNLLLLT